MEPDHFAYRNGTQNRGFGPANYRLALAHRAFENKTNETQQERGNMKRSVRMSLLLVAFALVIFGLSGAAFADNIAYFTLTNNSPDIPCTGANPCGMIDIGLGTGSFSGDLVVTVQLYGPGANYQFDRMGFNSDINSGLSLACFNFGSSCTSGVGGASLGGSMQEDGFGKFDYTVFTGLNGGSGCAPDGTGCQNLFTFVISDSNGALQLSDMDTFVAGHIANGGASGFIATGSGTGTTPEPSTLLLFGSGVLGALGYARRKL
jgi:hypothetical protein